MSESDFDTLHSRRGAGQDVIRLGGGRGGAGGAVHPHQPIFHFTMFPPISRSSGRSATAAAAYRAGEEITDERTGEVHDYTRKAGVLHSEIILPEGGTADRSEFWNAIEKHHKRGDAVLSREVEVALPTILTKEERQALAVAFARELADRYGVAVDVALHAPRTVTDKDLERNPDKYHETDPETGRRHNGNWHAHIMLSACHVSPTGELGKKAVQLDPIHCQRAKIENMADRERPRWAQLANGALERAGYSQRIDHRSLEAQGINREPTKHLGPAASALERRGIETELGRANRGLVSEIHIEQAPEAPQERPQTYREKLEQRRQQERERSDQKQPQLAPDAKGSTYRERLEQQRERDKAQGKDNDRGR